MKTGRDFLFQRWVLEQVASELLNRKLVERKITIEGVDHPFAVNPGMRTLTIT